VNADDLPPITTLARLHLEPGDVVIADCAGPITAEQAANIKAQLEHLLTPHQVIVTSGGITLSTLDRT
jgi:hypothetical protein